MNIKAIAQLCKERRRILIYNAENGVQWIGDGAAMYVFRNEVNLTKEDILKHFGISERQRRTYMIGEVKNEFRLEERSDGDKIAKPYPFSINYRSGTIQPIETSRGVKYIDTKYLSPFPNLSSFAMEYYERATVIKGEKATSFVITNDCDVAGIILEVRVQDDDFRKRFKELAKKIRG